MNRNKRMMLRLGTGLMAAVIVVGGTGCSTRVEGKNEEKETCTAQEKVTETVTGHGAEDRKTEMVYAIASADGNVKKTIVSEWLSNPSELEVIDDVSILNDIKNLKGDQEYTSGDEDKVSWKADGSDIYYSGTTDKELPVTVKITYTLDGKEIAPEELAGKSGKLKIRFDYTDNLSKEVTIDGKKETIYMPFAAISGMMLDNSKAKNITVTGGQVINDGEHSIAVGIAVPGLARNLESDNDKLKELLGDVDIPDSVEISADVTDFELLTTLTFIDNSIFKEIGTGSEGKLDLSSLLEKLGEMKDGVKALVDGSGELADGAGKLSDGAGELRDGLKSASDGAAALTDGAVSLHDGTEALKNGADELKTGIDALADGAGTLSGGLNTLSDSVAVLPGAAESLLSGMRAAVAALKSGDMSAADKYGIYEAATAAAAGSDQVLAGLKSNDVSAADKYGIYEAAAAINTGLAGIRTGAVSSDTSSPESYGIYEAADAVEKGLAALPAAVGSVATALTAEDAPSAYSCDAAAAGAINSVLQGDNLTEEQRVALQKALEAISYSQQYELGAAAGLASVDIQPAQTALEGIKQGATAISEGAAALQGAASAVMSGTDRLYAGVTQIKNADLAIADGVNELVFGNGGNNLEAVVGGLEQLSGLSSTLIEGVGKLKEGAAALSGGLDKVKESMPALTDGAKALEDGSLQLKDGCSALGSGIGELYEGSKKLKDGSDDLADGSRRLADGINEFDEKAVKKIEELLDGELTDIAEKLKASFEYAGEYTSFAGSADDSDTGVRFLIRTEGIKQ